MRSKAVVLLDPAVHQLLHRMNLLTTHTSRQVEIKTQPLSLQTSSLPLGSADTLFAASHRSNRIWQAMWQVMWQVMCQS